MDVCMIFTSILKPTMETWHMLAQATAEASTLLHVRSGMLDYAINVLLVLYFCPASYPHHWLNHQHLNPIPHAYEHGLHRTAIQFLGQEMLIDCELACINNSTENSRAC